MILAITSKYGAANQHLHAEMSSHLDPAQTGTIFSTILQFRFIPLRHNNIRDGCDTYLSWITPMFLGSKKNCAPKNIAVSGPKGTGQVWKMGWGALVNQQTFHKGMGFTQKGAA